MNGAGGTYDYRSVPVKRSGGSRAIKSGNQQDESAYEQSPQQVIELGEDNNDEEIKVLGETPSFPHGIGRRIPEEEIKASPKKLIKSHKDHIVMSGVSGPRPVKGTN